MLISYKVTNNNFIFFSYLCNTSNTNYGLKSHERCIRWNVTT